MRAVLNMIVVAGLALGAGAALAQGDPDEKRYETLRSLYSARWTQSICGLRFDDREKARLTDAIAFIEGRLRATAERKREVDAQAKSFVERVKAARDCEPGGGFDKIVREMIAELPDPEPRR